MSSNSIMPAMPQRKLFEKLMRLGSGGAVHDEDDAVRLVLEEPLVDFAGQMEVGRSRVLRKVRQRRSRRAFPWPSRYQSRRILVVGTATAASGGKIATLAPRFICSDMASLLLLVLVNLRITLSAREQCAKLGPSGPSGMIWNSINPPWSKGSLARPVVRQAGRKRGRVHHEPHRP